LTFYKNEYNINMKLKECENMETYRIYGELITSNLYRINNSINVSSISLENYYDNNNLITIPLDKAISPASNKPSERIPYNSFKFSLLIALPDVKI